LTGVTRQKYLPQMAPRGTAGGFSVGLELGGGAGLSCAYAPPGAASATARVSAARPQAGLGAINIDLSTVLRVEMICSQIRPCRCVKPHGLPNAAPGSASVAFDDRFGPDFGACRNAATDAEHSKFQRAVTALSSTHHVEVAARLSGRENLPSSR
jgi:hypothetical protein